LLQGEPQVTEQEGEGPVDAAAVEVRAENERIAASEEQVQALAALREEFARFKGQFE
jgi:hypothetical protein